MGLLDRLFRNAVQHTEQPSIRFGRYTDSYKAPSRYDAWDRAQDLFEEEQFLESYKHFLLYLRDDEEDNVHWKEIPGGLEFELYQGSKKLTGKATPHKIRVQAPVVKAESFNIGVLRRLLEQNFDLKYCRFTLDPEGNIVIVFDTYTLDGSPYKLYYALREAAIKADKQDDLLIEEFRNLQPVEITHLKELPQEEKEAKYRYIKQAIGGVMQEVEHGALDCKRYASSYGYLLLDLIFRLDYLIKPEGFMMETLEQLHRKYYENDGKNTAGKNEDLCKGLKALAERPAEDFYREMYRGCSTFGITHTVNHDRVVSIINGELYHMDWYLENGHERMAMAIPGYIVGFCLFNYAVPKPDRDLFHLYYQITEPAYFGDLGFTVKYLDDSTQQPDKRAIRRAINKIVDENKGSFPNFSFPTGSLDFSSLPRFARSYLTIMKSLNLVKAL
ncbi:hypothetical protein [Phaeodactylibacter xiamenensis]|uniref:hypothetical protein n=1 Tax=Phaeodactylibacter xiamenensis TaxID=1524460 RepID=UPI0024A8069D|nr:hypothetical protein [Phaeodactylibacter xiamenensis]